MSASPTISKYMTPDPFGMDESLTLADAADRMRAHEIQHLLVLDGSALVGVIRFSDVTLAALLAQDRAQRVSVEAAVRPAFTCPPDMPVANVAAILEANHLDCAVVVDDTRTVVGIFTLTDALRALRELAADRDAPPLRTPQRSDTNAAGHTDSPSPKVRVKRMLARRGATPTADDGMAFGSVFPNR